MSEQAGDIQLEPPGNESEQWEQLSPTGTAPTHQRDTLSVQRGTLSAQRGIQSDWADTLSALLGTSCLVLDTSFAQRDIPSLLLGTVSQQLGSLLSA